jgi:hypothetical protein
MRQRFPLPHSDQFRPHLAALVRHAVADRLLLPLPEIEELFHVVYGAALGAIVTFSMVTALRHLPWQSSTLPVA